VPGVERPRGSIESFDLGGGIIRCRCRLAVKVQGGLQVSPSFRALNRLGLGSLAIGLADVGGTRDTSSAIRPVVRGLLHHE